MNGILQLLNPDPQEKPKLTPGEDQLRQRDINLGSVLMLVAVIKVTLFLRFPPNLGIDPYFFILALLSLALGTLLLLSQLTHRRRGLTVGATMTFLAALIGLIGTFFWGIEVIPLIAIPTLFLIFTWYRLVLRVHQFFGSEPVSQMTDQQRYSTHEHLPAGQAALPPGDNLNAVDDLGLPNRQAVGQPVSVTEGTTELLKNQSQ